MVTEPGRKDPSPSPSHREGFSSPDGVTPSTREGFPRAPVPTSSAEAVIGVHHNLNSEKTQTQNMPGADGNIKGGETKPCAKPFTVAADLPNCMKSACSNIDTGSSIPVPTSADVNEENQARNSGWSEDFGIKEKHAAVGSNSNTKKGRDTNSGRVNFSTDTTSVSSESHIGETDSNTADFIKESNNNSLPFLSVKEKDDESLRDCNPVETSEQSSVPQHPSVRTTPQSLTGTSTLAPIAGDASTTLSSTSSGSLQGIIQAVSSVVASTRSSPLHVSTSTTLSSPEDCLPPLVIDSDSCGHPDPELEQPVDMTKASARCGPLPEQESVRKHLPGVTSSPASVSVSATSVGWAVTSLLSLASAVPSSASSAATLTPSVPGSTASILSSVTSVPSWTTSVPSWTTSVPSWTTSVPSMAPSTHNLAASVPVLAAPMPTFAASVPSSTLLLPSPATASVTTSTHRPAMSYYDPTGPGASEERAEGKGGARARARPVVVTAGEPAELPPSLSQARTHTPSSSSPSMDRDPDTDAWFRRVMPGSSLSGLYQIMMPEEALEDCSGQRIQKTSAAEAKEEMASAQDRPLSAESSSPGREAGGRPADSPESEGVVDVERSCGEARGQGQDELGGQQDSNSGKRCSGSGGARNLNRYGREFSNGRPLPSSLRQNILDLYKKGVRASEISRRMKVSHGCVSKILNRFKNKGTVEPGQIGGSKPKVTTPAVVKMIQQYKTHTPHIYAWEIRNRLLMDKVCKEKTLPSISSINRILRDKPVPSGQPEKHLADSGITAETKPSTDTKLVPRHGTPPPSPPLDLSGKASPPERQPPQGTLPAAFPSHESLRNKTLKDVLNYDQPGPVALSSSGAVPRAIRKEEEEEEKVDFEERIGHEKCEEEQKNSEVKLSAARQATKRPIKEEPGDEDWSGQGSGTSSCSPPKLKPPLPSTTSMSCSPPPAKRRSPEPSSSEAASRSAVVCRDQPSRPATPAPAETSSRSQLSAPVLGVPEEDPGRGVSKIKQEPSPEQPEALSSSRAAAEASSQTPAAAAPREISAPAPRPSPRPAVVGSPDGGQGRASPGGSLSASRPPPSIRSRPTDPVTAGKTKRGSKGGKQSPGNSGWVFEGGRWSWTSLPGPPPPLLVPPPLMPLHVTSPRMILRKTTSREGTPPGTVAVMQRMPLPTQMPSLKTRTEQSLLLPLSLVQTAPMGSAASPQGPLTPSLGSCEYNYSLPDRGLGYPARLVAVPQLPPFSVDKTNSSSVADLKPIPRKAPGLSALSTLSVHRAEPEKALDLSAWERGRKIRRAGPSTAAPQVLQPAGNQDKNFAAPQFSHPQVKDEPHAHLLSRSLPEGKPEHAPERRLRSRNEEEAAGAENRSKYVKNLLLFEDKEFEIVSVDRNRWVVRNEGELTHTLRALHLNNPHHDRLVHGQLCGTGSKGAAVSEPGRGERSDSAGGKGDSINVGVSVGGERDRASLASSEGRRLLRQTRAPYSILRPQTRVATPVPGSLVGLAVPVGGRLELRGTKEDEVINLCEENESSGGLQVKDSSQCDKHPPTRNPTLLSQSRDDKLSHNYFDDLL